MLSMGIPDVDILAVHLFSVFLMYSPNGTNVVDVGILREMVGAGG